MTLSLGEIIKLEKGKKPKVQSTEFREGYLANIDIKAFEHGEYEYYTDGVGCVLCDDDDILIVCDGSRSGLVGRAKKGVVGSTLAKIEVSDAIDKRFLFYFIQAHYTYLNTKTKGTGTPHMNPALLYSFSFPIIAEKEQHRIVGKIDALFSKLDKGVEILQTLRQQLRTYRQAVLKWAFEDCSTERKPMKIVSTAFGGAAFKSGDFLSKGEYQVIKIGNVRPGVVRLQEKPAYIDNITGYERYLLKKGDVIITLTGTRKKRDYGFTAIVANDNLLLNQRVAAIRFYENYMPKFFMYYSWTRAFQDDFFEDETGNVGQGNVGMKAITETLIPYCPIDKQRAIIAAIESRLSLCDKLEQIVGENLAKAQALRQSILKKAFTGQLVPQDPSDEPAEKLLERIKAVKTTATVKTRVTRGKRK